MRKVVYTCDWCKNNVPEDELWKLNLNPMGIFGEPREAPYSNEDLCVSCCQAAIVALNNVYHLRSAKDFY